MGDHFRDDVQLTMKIFDTVISQILTYWREVWGVDHDGKLENDPIELVQSSLGGYWELTNSVAQMRADRR